MLYILLLVPVLFILVSIFPSLSPMIGYGIAAKVTKVVPLDSSMAVDVEVRRVFGAMDCRTVGRLPNRLIGRRRIGIRSWGEDVVVTWTDRELTVASHCIFPLQVIDYGKNRSNVEEFISKFQRPGSPNQSMDPTPVPVTPVAGQPARQP